MTTTDPAQTTKYVFDFSEGDKDQKDLLGGKGANLAEMVRLGLPVPPGFTISTEACRAYLEAGTVPAGLDDQVAAHLATLEETRGKKLGDPDDPLLVSVRSGAKFSMPGMMETVLNIGLNDASVHGLAAQSDNPRFAWDSYRRLIQMFGKTVQHIDGERFEHALEELKERKGVHGDLDLDAADLEELVGAFREIVREHTGSDFPQDPREQLAAAIDAVFSSWNSDRAVLYRRQERIPNELGTAVNVVAMVFGNTGPDSGTGVCFTRDPATGAQGVYGDYLQNAQGEDVVAGIRNTVPLAQLEEIDKVSYDELLRIMALLEGHYRDLCDIEFTIERGTLWMLQTRVGKRTAAAAFRIATQLVDEGLIDADEAVRRVSGAQLVQLMFPRFDTSPGSAGEKAQVLGRGMSASPGAAVGKAVFDSYTAVKWSRSGEKVILVRRETNPDDLNGMIAAEGILTSRGGKTSHAAVVARGMGKTCVCGAEELNVDTKRRRLTAPDGTVIDEGDVISVDGSSGLVYAGEVPVMAPPVVEYFEGSLDADAAEADDLVRAVDRVMARADEVRRLRVRANADTVEDAERARRFGGEGIGLCRTEHMFLGERRQHVERLILAEDDEARAQALDALLPLQRWDFLQILTAMDGLPTTIRLLDPPLHEFLPNITELSVRVALAEARGEANENDLRLMQAVHSPARAEPDARPARRPVGAGRAGPVRPAGPGDRRGHRPADQDGPRPAAGDHDPAGRVRAGAGDHPRGQPEGPRRGRRADRGRLPGHDRDDDRAAAGGDDGRADRRGRRVLLLRHQRPHPDHVGVLPRRRGGRVLLHLPGDGHLRGLAVRDPGRRGGRRAGQDRHRTRAGHAAGPQGGGLRRTRRRPGLRALLPQGRPGLRVVLALPHPGRPARSGPSGS